MKNVLEALNAIRNGKMVILVDDEDRENEGDLVMAADLVTPEAINFMAKWGRGLICMTLTEERLRALEIPMMVEENTSSFGTAFTVSIEARAGVSTGISAADRAQTIRVALAEDTKPSDLLRPGHVFPLRAKRGGVLVRTGQTEGSVDLARLAGLKPAGVICEIMNDDGSMARRPDLEKFAKEHGLIILSIAELIGYRLAHDKLVARTKRYTLEHSKFGKMDAQLYQSEIDGAEHLALIVGDISGDAPVLVRVQAECGNWFSSAFCDCGTSMIGALEALKREGRGVFIGLSGGHGGSVGGVLAARAEQSAPPAVAPRNVNTLEGALREFGVGAQILRDLGLKKIKLLTNHPKRLPGVEGYGLEIEDQVAIGDATLGMLTKVTAHE